MNQSSVDEHIRKIAEIVVSYQRLPFSMANIPGQVMEAVLAYVLDAEALATYDFVDVVKRQNGIGWQVKSTFASTPVTWKRAKIPDRNGLIEASEKSEAAVQALGDAIIDFCNHHAQQSLDLYGLDKILYSRLIVKDDGNALYFEKQLCSRENPIIFSKKDFVWHWSTPKTTTKKEQLPALHGVHVPTGKKWFAWHGRGENQLHFSGEKAWWPEEGNPHAITFRLPTADEKLSLEQLISLLAEFVAARPPVTKPD